MKKYFMLALVAIFTIGLSMNAQNQRQPKGEGRHGDHNRKITPELRVEKMSKELNLTADEKAKVLQLFVQQEEKMKAIKAENEKLIEKKKAEVKERMEKFDAERKAQDAELEKIIGKEKFAKHQALRIEQLEKMNRMGKMKDMRKKREGVRHDGPRPEQSVFLKCIKKPANQPNAGFFML